MTVDTLITNVQIVDGTASAKAYPGDLAVTDGRISAMGDLGRVEAGTVLDAAGQVLCPGFIDVHVHSELALLGGRDRFAGVCQGVTTQLTSPDGFGWAGLPERKAQEYWQYTSFISCDAPIQPPWRKVDTYHAEFTNRLPSHLAIQAPHHAIRLDALGWACRAATDDELAFMGDRLHAWFDAGACALATGLDYQPGACADFHELAVLGGIVRERKGVFAMHIRTQEYGRERAWQEVVALAREGVPVHVSHERVDQESEAALESIEKESLDVTFDTYLYSAGMTHLTLMLPIAYQIGDPDTVYENLRSPAAEEELRPFFRNLFHRSDPIVAYTGSGRFTGMTLKEAAASEGKPYEKLAYDILVEEQEKQAFIFPWDRSANEIERILCDTARHPRMLVASDGIFTIPHPHPRSFGCYPRIIEAFVRNRGVLSLEDAVYKMSGFPAERFTIPHRGVLKPGNAADLVIFDPDTVGSPATFSDPLQPPTGIHHVMVNGTWVVRDGSPLESLPGLVLKA